MEPSCGIWRDTIQTGSSSNDDSNNVSATECGHVFHDVCLRRWLAASMTCPTCFKELRSDKIVKLYLDGAALLPQGCIRNNNGPLEQPEEQLGEVRSQLVTAAASQQRYQETIVALRDKIGRTEAVARRYKFKYAMMLCKKYRLKTQLRALRQEVRERENVRRENLFVQGLLRISERQLEISEQLRRRLDQAVDGLRALLAQRESVLRQQAQQVPAIQRDALQSDEFELHSLQRVPPTDRPGAQPDSWDSEQLRRRLDQAVDGLRALLAQRESGCVSKRSKFQQFSGMRFNAMSSSCTTCSVCLRPTGRVPSRIGRAPKRPRRAPKRLNVRGTRHRACTAEAASVPFLCG
ncbi:hypothetical protein HPB50_028358 [Hyalomma asiaticum]|nr:hypothetical protein HPB50_028358 [Hyalomma asiaticum]